MNSTFTLAETMTDERKIAAFKAELKNWKNLSGDEKIAMMVWLSSLPENETTKKLVKLLNKKLEEVRK